MRRVQSASSINTYKQCPRKYFYRYIQKLPDEPNIHAVRGNIAHSALEHFFRMDPNGIIDYKKEIPLKVENLFDTFWVQNKDKLKQLKLDLNSLNEHYLEGRRMINSWANKFVKKVDPNVPFATWFNEMKPEVELKFSSEKLGVTGFVDAIYHKKDKIIVIDYKTSSKDIITPEYSLQAGIYAILINESRGIMPTVVSFDFLKGETRELIVDEILIKNTLFEIEQIHASTATDSPFDYKKKPTALCKWCNAKGSGQCAYFDICKPFENK